MLTGALATKLALALVCCSMVISPTCGSGGELGMRPVRQLHRSGFIEGYRNPHRGLLLRHQRRERRTVAYHHRLAAGGVAAIDGTHRAAGALKLRA